MFILLNLFITGSCSCFDGAVVGGWLCLVKPPSALLLPLVLLVVCGLSGDLSGCFFFFPVSASFIQRPEGERLILIHLSFPEWHEFEQLEVTEVPSKTLPAPPGVWLCGWGSCSRLKSCPSYEELRGQSGEREGEGKLPLLYRTAVLLR